MEERMMLKKILPLTLLLFAAALVVQGQETTPKPSQAPAPPKTQLKVGQLAPEFTLPDTTGKPVSLADFKGKKNVVLAFYVLAFTGG
jgi:cytochrome oxidase Cu insertion factor (SCO1/SenC/PrrC family)